MLNEDSVPSDLLYGKIDSKLVKESVDERKSTRSTLYILNESPLSLNFPLFNVPVASRPSPIRLRSLRQESCDFPWVLYCALPDQDRRAVNPFVRISHYSQSPLWTVNQVEGSQLRVIDPRKVPNHRWGSPREREIRPRRKEKKGRNQPQRVLITRDEVE